MEWLTQTIVDRIVCSVVGRRKRSTRMQRSNHIWWILFPSLSGGGHSIMTKWKYRCWAMKWKWKPLQQQMALRLPSLVALGWIKEWKSKLHEIIQWRNGEIVLELPQWQWQCDRIVDGEARRGCWTIRCLMDGIHRWKITMPLPGNCWMKQWIPKRNVSMLNAPSRLCSIWKWRSWTRMSLCSPGTTNHFVRDGF